MRIAVSAAMAAMALSSASHAMAAEPASSFETMTTPDAKAATPLLEARLEPNTDHRFDTRFVTIGSAFDSDGHAIRHRLGSAMMEYYPFAHSGFHFSGGARFYSVTNFQREADKLTNYLLWSPMNHSNGVRMGFKRQTPAMTFGYTQTIAQKLAFGLEAGSMLGRATAGLPRAIGHNFGDGNRDTRLNPMANLVFGFKF